MLLLSINLSLSLIFLFMNHPLSMGLLLLTQTITISLITGMLAFNFWFSYIIFLIMVGGMLVIFIYMTSIASNEMFHFSTKLIMMFMMSTMIMMITMMFLDSFYINIMHTFTESNMNSMMFNNNLSKYFNYPSMLIIFFMIIYLFITLIAVVKITKIEYGPLRHNY